MSRTASPVAGDDPRRRIPRTDAVLALDEVERAKQRLGEERVRNVVRDMQSRARAGEIAPEEVEGAVIAALESVHACAFTPVLNATGVIVHTNLGRAPLSPQAIDALEAAAGYVDVEFDLATGLRGKRGVST
ncbi:MAG: L-seryl-tRNA(Sec) selenium transferase, partial [Dermabacter sp.]|nr:L-seryl-tRNA(Sec) selenium transferase [Dermabacter sp.]